MHRITRIKRSRSLIISALIVLSLVGVGYDSQPALKNQADEIDASLKAIEKRISSGGHLSFQQPDIQSALGKLQKLSVDLSKASIHADATKSPEETAIITSVGEQYLSELFTFHVVYAQAAHALSANTPDFNFDTLAAYTLKLKPSTALDLLKQKPFNSRHLNTNVIEFFINSEDKQMAEFFALTSPKDELSYAKLIQFSALRETFTNLWAIQRLTSTEIPTQTVKSCAPELLSFRSPPSGNLKESDPYLELTASDRYNALTTLVDGAFQKTLALPFLSTENYYEVLSQTLSSAPEFKNYTSGVEPKAVSSWLNDASGSIAKVEQNDWAGNSKNSEKILGGSTLMNDKLSSSEIARRMSETLFERRETAAIAQISAIAANNVKVQDLSSIQKKAKDFIDSYRTQWIANSEQRIIGSISALDQSALKNQDTAARTQEKVDHTLALASYLMPAVHDHDLIAQNLSQPVERAGDVPRFQKNLTYVYLRPQFKLAITDPETFKTYLLKEIQNQLGLWSSFQKNSNAMILLNSYFVEVTENFKKKIDASKVTNSDQAARIFLSVAQTAASRLIQNAAPTGKKISLLRLVAQNLDISSVNGLITTAANVGSVLSRQAADQAPQKLLQSAFDSINLLSAKNPTDLEPQTSQQEDLASIVMDQGYELNPLLGVRSGDGTILERIYREALENTNSKQLDYSIGGRIVLEGIQTAAQDIQGKLEDFCQANVANPARDLRFRKLFRSANSLRQILMHSQGATKTADMAKFDESLMKKTQTTTEKVLSKFIRPLFMVMSAAMLLVLIISIFNPLTTVPALASLMVIVSIGANFGMIGLAAVSSYFEINSLFIEQPAQIKYQEAIASAQVSSDEPFEQWSQLKSMGLISSVTNRASADQAKQALVTSQVMEIPQLAMNAWIGYGGLKQVASNIGLTGMLKYKELVGADMPGWAEKTAPPLPKTFSENLKEQGTVEAVKQKASQLAGVVKNIVGASPVFGSYTSDEALSALKSALARVLPDDSKELLPEVELYRDFLQGRLKVTNEVSMMSSLGDGTIDAPAQVLNDDMPDFIKTNPSLNTYEDSGARTADGAGQIFTNTGKPLDQVRRFWTETPQLEGNLSWKEMIENPELLKWRLIPKSALKAARAGSSAFSAWVKQYGDLVKLTDMMRGEMISQKLQNFESLITKIEGLSSQGMNTTEVLRSLNSQEMGLLQEAARGPRLLAFGYWATKTAEQNLALPLRQSTDVFDSYNSMIQSLKPNDWTPPANTAKAASPEQADIRNFYRLTKNLDAQPGVAPTQKTITIEATIERNLFKHAN
jgi:hypothetical protein